MCTMYCTFLTWGVKKKMFLQHEQTKINILRKKAMKDTCFNIKKVSFVKFLHQSVFLETVQFDSV